MTEKLYYVNPYQKTFFAHVVRCEPADGKWHVVLDRTSFYPEGGGQPADSGVLNLANVLDVQERGGEIVHVVDRPLTPGSGVTGGVNWARRFRLMQQHTGEHIVSGIAHRLFGVDNVGFHMGERAITVDWNGRIDENSLELIERLANEAVFRNLPVRAYYPPEEELRTLAYRSKKELFGAVRIVTIPGYDVCACCGTHVARTGEVGAVKIIGSQSYKGGTRITMVCGAQAVDDYDEKQRSVAAVSALFSAKPEEIAAAADRLLRENADLKRQVVEARSRLLELKASAVPETEGNICRFEKNLSPDDLRRYASLLARRCSGVAAAFSGADGSYRYALVCISQDVRPFGKRMNAEFGGRGGGSAELMQGSLTGTRTDLERFFAGGGESCEEIVRRSPKKR
jgi:alanyl-tRNA synthetase